MKKVDACLWCGSRDLKIFANRKDSVGLMMCTKCQLVMVDSIHENLQDHYYTEGYYNPIEENSNVDTGYGDTYDLMSPCTLYWQNALIELGNGTNSKRQFLEIGCATGNLLEILRDNQNNLGIEGIDLSKYAVSIAVQKGLIAKAAPIERYKSKSKKNIIFSSETMEHVDDLRSFLKGVKNNLSDEGVFIFYVPSISLEEASDQGGDYIRFCSNLEHILHFTPQFLRRELTDYFHSNVLIEEIVTSFGPCAIGAVSKNKKLLNGIKTAFHGIHTDVIPNKVNDSFLKSLAILALKFGKFDLADKIINRLKKRKGHDDEIVLIEALKFYHRGELIKSNLCFEAYLRNHPNDLFTIKSILSNEREINGIYRQEVERSAKILSDLNHRNDNHDKFYRKKLADLRRGINKLGLRGWKSKELAVLAKGGKDE